MTAFNYQTVQILGSLIVMSALIAILTLSRLAFGVSRNAGLQQPLATAIIFGLTATVPLVLYFLPATIGIVTRQTAFNEDASRI